MIDLETAALNQTDPELDHSPASDHVQPEQSSAALNHSSDLGSAVPSQSSAAVLVHLS